MQKTQKINFSEIGIKQHKKKDEKLEKKKKKNIPPDPSLILCNFTEFYKFYKKKFIFFYAVLCHFQKS